MRNMILILLLLSGGLSPAAEVELNEWQVPYQHSRPRDPFVDSLGRVWFCGQTGEYLAYLEPETGEFKKYALSDGAGPHNLIIDKEDQVWFAANTLPYIGRLDPDSGKIRKYPMPPGTAHDPHTLVFDQQGDIWFTAQWSNYIGRLKTGTGNIDLIAIPESGSRPYGIKMDANNQPWVVLFGTNKLATVNASSLKLKIIELPDSNSRPRRLEIGDDGAIWYGDYSRGYLGRYDPAEQSFREWPLPGGASSRPYGVAKDHYGNIWLAEGTNPNRLVEFDVSASSFTTIVEVTHAGGAIRHMYSDQEDQSIWFGEDTNYIGRIRIP